MRNVLSSKEMGTDSLARQKRMVGAILWSIQGALALLFLFAILYRKNGLRLPVSDEEPTRI